MKWMNGLAQAVSTRKRAWLIIAIWLIMILAFTLLAPASKPFAVQTGEGSAFTAKQAEQAEALLKEQFPEDNGVTALFVFHRDSGLTEQDLSLVTDWSKWLASSQRPGEIHSAMPYHLLPAAARASVQSEDGSTLLFSLSLQEGLDTKAMGRILDTIKEQAAVPSNSALSLNVTGPAGIAADTSRLFQNADFVLMAATVVLILVLLIVIYRSPLLAILPLLIAGLVYQLVDRTIGLLGDMGWITIDRSAMSIMLVLLFAVLTDYSLFIFSRFREELRYHESPFQAMQVAVRGVAEAILYSGGTVLFAMLALFGTVFNPYHAFASVFTIAILWMLAAGLTLIPAVYAIAGRASFWPFMSRVRYEMQIDTIITPISKDSIWARLSHIISKRPRVISITMLIVMTLMTATSFQVKYSYNLLHSFPSSMGARIGFDQLANTFPPGELAPVTIILTHAADKQPQVEQLLKLEEQINAWDHVARFAWKRTSEAAEQQALRWSADGSSLAGELILDEDPYSNSAIHALSKWRDNTENTLQRAGLSINDNRLHYAGQTADQADIQKMNTKDTLYLFGIVTLALLLMLTMLNRSFWTAAMMTGTMLLSFGTTIGAGWLFVHEVLGLDAISYRLPVYTFLFMIALGVDYSIMMVTRIREEARVYPWRIAVEHGVAKTSGVISAAGVILAATFGVLSTQPLQELMLFGFMMVFGILLDTFFVRAILLPALFIGFEKQFRPSSRKPSGGTPVFLPIDEQK